MPLQSWTPKITSKSLAIIRYSPSFKAAISVSQVVGLHPLPSNHSVNTALVACTDWSRLSRLMRLISWWLKCNLNAIFFHVLATSSMTLTTLPLRSIRSSSCSLGTDVMLRELSWVMATEQTWKFTNNHYLIMVNWDRTSCQILIFYTNLLVSLDQWSYSPYLIEHLQYPTLNIHNACHAIFLKLLLYIHNLLRSTYLSKATYLIEPNIVSFRKQ